MGLISSKRAKQSAESRREGRNGGVGVVQSWGQIAGEMQGVDSHRTGDVKSLSLAPSLLGSQSLFFCPPLDFCLSLCDLHTNI